MYPQPSYYLGLTISFISDLNKIYILSHRWAQQHWSIYTLMEIKLTLTLVDKVLCKES